MLSVNSLATVEKLILLVKDNPVIYDSNKPRDNQRLRSAWTKIAAAMGDNAVNGEGWKSKWKNIRDSYTRKKRKTSRGLTVYDSRREWPFMGMLNFLDKHVHATRKGKKDRQLRLFKLEPGDDDSEAGCLVDMSDCERSVDDCRTNDRQAGEENSTEDVQDSNYPGSGTGQELDDGDDFESVLNNMDYPQEYAESSSYEDPDGNDAFFRSCSCRMNTLSQQSQSLLRLQITQLFFNAENPDLPDLEITKLPHKNKNDAETG